MLDALYNGFIEIAPVKGLTLKSQYGYNYRDNYIYISHSPCNGCHKLLRLP